MVGGFGSRARSRTSRLPSASGRCRCGGGYSIAIAWIGDVGALRPAAARAGAVPVGQIMGIVFGQAAGGVLGDTVGWRGTMLIVGGLHLAAGIMLWLDMRRSGQQGAQPTGEARWRQSAVSAARALQSPWVRTMLITVFLEGFAMFGAFAFVGAELHLRFGISLAAAGLILAVMGAGAMLYVASAGYLVRRLQQTGLVRLGIRTDRARLYDARRDAGGLDGRARDHSPWGSASICSTIRCRRTQLRWRRRLGALTMSPLRLHVVRQPVRWESRWRPR